MSPPPKARPFVPGEFAPEVVWKGDQLIVTAFGSGTCKPVATEAVVSDTHTVLVRFDEPGANPGQACTDDYAPNRSRIPAPTGDIDLASDVYAVFELAGASRQLIPVQLVSPNLP